MKCAKTVCQCTHTEGCVAGFIWGRYVDRKKYMINGKITEKEMWYEGVSFCPTCYPERADIQKTSRSSEEMAERLRNLSPLISNPTDNYIKEEKNKTQIL